MFTADLDGVDELRRAWGDAESIVLGGVRIGVTKGVEEGTQEARTRHIFKNRSGKLEKSIEGTIVGWQGETFKGVIRASAKYASYVEGGTRPHIIMPRRGSTLAFNDSSGRLRFARIVRHPGTRPMPFMGLAYMKAERVIIREIELSVERAQARLDR